MDTRMSVELVGYLYRRLKDQDIGKLISIKQSKPHETYLKKMGFQKRGDCYEKEMKECVAQSSN